jgi:tetratricopeptide (TPR) repeat protein
MPSKTRARPPIRQRAKGAIDPVVGQRVRAIREARQLTQAQLAGDEFSPGFISLVETGRTRMSLRAAELVAGRLGVTVADLLAPSTRADSPQLELRIIEAEGALRTNDPARAVALCDELLPRATSLFRARLQRLRGRALTQLGRPREAVLQLDEALRAYRAADQREPVVRILYDLSVAHARLDQVNEALALGLECERALANRELVDRTLELQVLSFLCAAFVRLGDFGSAELRTERASAVAEDVTDLRAVGSLYASLAITRQEQGDHDAALEHARRSLAAYEALGHQQAIGSTWNTIGWVQLQKGHFARAEQALAKADAVAGAQHDGALAAMVLQTRADLALARGNVDDAVVLAEQSAKHPNASARCKAGSLLLRAQALAKSEARLGQVNAAFADAFAASESQGRSELARAYEAHFEALLARGEPAAAANAAQRAFALRHPALSTARG